MGSYRYTDWADDYLNISTACIFKNNAAVKWHNEGLQRFKTTSLLLASLKCNVIWYLSNAIYQELLNGLWLDKVKISYNVNKQS